jgi:hypothetical protein
MDFGIINGCCHCKVNHILINNNTRNISSGKLKEKQITVISFNNTSGRLAERKIRSNFNLFLYNKSNKMIRQSIKY